MSWKKLKGGLAIEYVGLVFDILAQVVVQGILVALENRQLHTLVGPQAVEGCEVVFRHGLFGANVRRRVDHFGVTLHVQVSMHGKVSMFSVGKTYNVVLILKVSVVLLHGGVDGLEGRDEVVEDGGAP
jgi:hypothetical protein